MRPRLLARVQREAIGARRAPRGRRPKPPGSWIFKQFYLESLGHASYFVGSEETGEALVLDVRRDVETYFAEARNQGMRTRYACDIHQHNDYVTGVCELPERGDIQLLAGARSELGYEVTPMADGGLLEMGEVGVELLHTPGHISLLITDRSRGEEPAILFSGGALLVGDLARPDLLGGEVQTPRSASMFCRTLQSKILTLPNFVEVYPTHVSGSLCGGSIGSRLSTTIGYERRMNRLMELEPFVQGCLGVLPDLVEQGQIPLGAFLFLLAATDRFWSLQRLDDGRFQPYAESLLRRSGLSARLAATLVSALPQLPGEPSARRAMV
jgi:hydroxyacylglutathione hydrolase